jgi:hypothetical protein
MNLVDPVLCAPVRMKVWPLGRVAFGPAALKERRKPLRFVFLDDPKAVYSIAIAAQKKLLDAMDYNAASA